MILVRNDIEDVVEIDSLRSQFREEVIGIEIRETQERPQLNVITYYNPPTNRVNSKICEHQRYHGTNTIITGDLNCKHISWGSTTMDNFGSNLCDVLEDQRWVILNDGSKTRYDPASGKEEVLDLIICTPQTLKMRNEFYVGEDVGSNHYALHADLIFKNPMVKSPTY
jgi:hypothetical protein